MRGIVTAASAFMTNGGEVCDELLHGTEFSVLEERGGAYYIETDYGYRGEISEGVLIGSDKPPRGRRLISSGFADILEKPSIRSAIIVTLPMGSAVWRISSVDNGFDEIRTAGGFAGYVRSDLLKLPKTGVVMRSDILASALRYLGAQYRWGGKSPAGIDCSGLCFMAYLDNGLTIYRDAELRGGYALKPIRREHMQIADLAFLPGHVAMYAGGGRFIHSSLRNNGVAIDRLEGYPVQEPVIGSAFTN